MFHTSSLIVKRLLWCNNKRYYEVYYENLEKYSAHPTYKKVNVKCIENTKVQQEYILITHNTLKWLNSTKEINYNHRHNYGGVY